MKTLIALGYYGLGTTELAVIAIVLLLFLVPYILYLVTLSSTIKLCANQNRSIEPGQVWLVLIPIFGLIWYFIMVGRIADTIAAECRQRNIPLDEQRPGYNVGLALCVLSCCGWIPVLGGFCSIAAFICWIIYWVRIYGYKTKLQNTPFGFGHNPNPYPFPNQFPGQPPQPNFPPPPTNQNPYNNPNQP
jgi:hypothetical protein